MSEQTVADAERAADVPKVEREGYEETVAAEEADRVAQPPAHDAQARADELENPDQPDEKAKVKVTYSGEPARVTVGSFPAVDFTSRKTAEVSPEHAKALAHDFEVEQA